MRKLFILIMVAIIGITCLSACENNGNENNMVESNSETIMTETTTMSSEEENIVESETIATETTSENNDLPTESNIIHYKDMPAFNYTADRAELEAKIAVDGFYSSYSFDGLQPYFDQTGATMLPMTHFNELFKGNVRYEIDNDKVTITKNVLDVITVVSITADSNILIRDEKEIIMDPAPIQKDGTIYIPLEFVGLALSYGVSWYNRLEEVGFRQYTSVYVYQWNENEDSSSSGIRYSYTISGDRTVDFSKIKSNAFSDFDNIREVLEKLPAGAEVLTTELYRIKGYDVPDESFDSIVGQIRIMGLKSRGASRCLDEISPIIKDLSDYTNGWYSRELMALDEEAIYNSEGHIYRYTCFPAFATPIVVRIEINDDGTADVYYKVSKDYTHEGGGGISKSETAKLSENETQEFLSLLSNADYWNLPKEIDELGWDGHDVVVEGIKDGTYHIVDRWSPKKPDPVSDLEDYFVSLIKEKFFENKRF